MAEEEQPLQPIKKIDDEVLDRFINTYGFKQEVQQTKKGDKPYNIASASIDNNIYIIRKNKKNEYSFLSVSKENFEKFRVQNDEGFTFKFIDFNTKYFKKNEQKFIKSLKENKMFDDIEVKDGDYGDFKKKTIQTFTKYTAANRIKNIDPKEIPDIQPEPVPEKKDEEELMGDDDDDEEEESRMIDEEEEEEKQRKEIEEKKRKMKEEEEEKPDAFEDNQVFIEDEYDKEKEYSDDEKDIFKLAKKMSDGKLNSQLAQYKRNFNQKSNTKKLNKQYKRFFNELEGSYGFTVPKGNKGNAYLKVGDDIIFVRKLPENTKGQSRYKKYPIMIASVNKSDFPKIESDNGDVKVRYFNFDLDYYNKNKDKFEDAIKDKKFVFDQDLEKINDEVNFSKYYLNKDDLEKYTIIPKQQKDFDYRKIFNTNNTNDNDNQLIIHAPDGNILKSLIRYDNSSDSLLKLIVNLSNDNKGEVDFKEIGEIQDLNGDITNLYSDMQDLKTKINSSNNAEEKERLLIKYNKKRLKLEDLIKKYSKEAYRLSMLNKKHKATYSNPNYIKNKLNKL